MRIGIESYLAELVGTFILVLTILGTGGNAYLVGLSLAVVILFTGAISGGMVNPAVSFAMYLKGMLMPIEFAYYVIAQLLGGAGAFYAFKMIKA